MTGQEAEAWGLRVLDELELPGWFRLPVGATADEAATWRAATFDQVMATLEGRVTADVSTDVSADVRAELDFALATASTSEALVAFQVWPVAQPISLLCSVHLYEGEFSLEDEGDRVVVHEAEGRHLGPGWQYTVERPPLVPSAAPLVATHFVFSDGLRSLAFSLSDCVPAVTALALPSFVELKDAVGLHRADGTRFEAAATVPDLAPDHWQIGETV